MVANFDIFKKLPDGKPLWVQAVGGLDEAKSHISRLSTSSSSPGEYFLLNIRNGSVIEAAIPARP